MKPINILNNLSESNTGDLYNFAQGTSVNDFIADGTYSFSQKINYIAEQLEESGNVDTYKDEHYNKYLLDVSNILKDAANKIENLEVD